MSGKPLYRAITRLLETLLASGSCHGCGCELDTPRQLCGACRARLPRVPNPCLACAEPNPVTGPVCPRCLLNPPRWQKIVAPFQYRGLVREYILQLKFNDALFLGKELCRESLCSLRGDAALPEVLLPVPLHRKRLFERGYNQADEIAQHWARELGIRLDRRALTRQRHTASQSGLSPLQRKQNLRRAFAYAPRRPYRHVALVDDIVTTGATADEITRLLHRGGVEFVEVWALARTYRD